MMQTAERMRRKAWQSYLDSTRATRAYDEVEPAAWARLQERLAGIDEELLQALAEHE